jgi:ACS family glucarate transporter-like MFS transporter
VSRYRYYVLAVLCSLSFLTYLDRICIMRVQTEITSDLQFNSLTQSDQQSLQARGLQNDPVAVANAAKDRGTERMSWVFAAFALGYMIFELPGGWLGDKWGSRAIIFRIVLCWSLFTALTGGVKGITNLFAKNAGPEHWFASLLLIRFLFGAFEAGAYPNIARSLGRWFPFHERATAQSFIWFSSRLGGAFAPPIIGSLMQLSGSWQVAFYVLGIIGFIWAFFFFAWFRDRPEDQPSVDPAEREFIRQGASPASIYDDASTASMPWKALLSTNILALCVVQFSVSFCFYFFITFLPRYLKDQFGFDFQRSQWISGLPLFLGAFACVAGGFLSDFAIRKTGSRRWGRSLIPIIAWTAAAICTCAVPAFDSPYAVMALLTVGFVFQDLGVASMWSLPADIGGRFTATLGAWMNTIGCIAAMTSPLTAAKMSIAFGWNSLFYVFAVVYLIGALAWARVDATSPIIQSNSRSP